MEFLMILFATTQPVHAQDISHIEQRLIRNSHKGAVPAHELAYEIYYAAKRHHVDAELLTRIVLVESGAVAHAVNKVTLDYGLCQINIKTAQALNVDMSCLMDWKCNLETGAEVLSSLTRPCGYNIGPRRVLKGDKLVKCLRYESNLAKMN